MRPQKGLTLDEPEVRNNGPLHMVDTTHAYRGSHDLQRYRGGELSGSQNFAPTYSGQTAQRWAIMTMFGVT